jgi:hypothetical protein
MKVDTVDQTFSTYKLIYASLRAIQDIAESSEPVIQKFYKNIPFWGKNSADFDSQMIFTVTEFDDVMVLALFAAFERELRTSIQDVISANLHTQNQTVLRLAELTSDSIERWTMADMLSALCDIVDGSTRGQVKQVYEYRNWVAHGKNQHKIPAIKASPRFTFNLLTRFITQASAVL